MSDTLGIILFFVIGFSWTIYVIQEMFITGSSALNLSIAKDDGERKQIQVASGLHFDGIEVWLVGSIALLFASFPLAFAEIFTHLYIPFFLLVYALIGRGLSIEFIFKMESKKWIKSMSIIWAVSSIAIMFILGIYLTNIFYGFPIGAEGMEKGFGSIFNVTGIAGGLFFVLISLVGGAAWIKLTTSGELGDKAMVFIKKIGVIYTIPIMLLLVFMGFNNTEASIFIGELFTASPLFFLLPALTVTFAVLTTYSGYKGKAGSVFRFALLTLAFFLITGFVGIYPYMLPSYVDTQYGITLFDAMARRNSLLIIVITVSIFFPVIIFYQSWKYVRFTKKVNYNDE